MPETAVLKIYDVIGDEGITPKYVSDFLDANAESKEIKVKINSPGGSVFDGWAIHDLLINSGKEITTVAEGKCFSIATVIFLAGSVRQVLKNSDGLIHNPYITSYGESLESSDLLELAERMAFEEEKVLNLYAEVTGTDKAKLAEYMKTDTYLSAEDMLNLGFATEILEPIKAFAYLKSNNIMNEIEKKAFFERVGNVIDSAIAKAFSRLPVNQELTDTSGKKLTLEKESGAPAVGDVASPDGTYVFDGNTVVVADGKVTSVTPMEEDKADELTKAQAEIQRLTDELTVLQNKQAELDTAKAELETAKADLETEKTEAVNLITELRALKNEWKPEGRAKGEGGTNKVDGIDMNRVSEIVNKQNK